MASCDNAAYGATQNCLLYLYVNARYVVVEQQYADCQEYEVQDYHTPA